jgi:uncharacterized 2Fe-2S/4Fe-4S cluster protein (DUF4445 family)
LAVIRVISAKNTREIKAEPGPSLLKTLQSAGIYLPAICGGRGSCGKCKIKLISGALEAGPADRACFSPVQLEEGWRLACAAFPAADIHIEVSETGEQNFSSVNSFEQGDEDFRGLDEAPFKLEKNPQSYARQAEPGRPLSYAELREISKIADAQARLSEGAGAAGTAAASAGGVGAAAGAAAGASAGGVGAAADAAAGASASAAVIPETLSIYREGGNILRVGGAADRVYSAAIDIGTTTLALALLDMRTGTIAGKFSAVNRQREFGGDVISRIQRAGAGDLPLLSASIRKQIGEGIVSLCAEAAAEIQDVRKIAITGNTTMIHLLLGLSCKTLGQVPFTPVTLDMVSLKSREIFDEDLSCETIILPGISTYVGADISAGILFAGIHANPGPVAFMDIGTNGEMALAYKGKILCTATAAGPAFEGGNILWGTGSVPGAISQVSFKDGRFACNTIGGRPALGICGSGVVDTVYQGLKNDLIQASGRFNKKTLPANEIVLAKTEDGRDIVFCQKDVRELQLGKSAIRSGLDALLNHAGLAYDEVKTLFIAGGFGFNLNMESGAGIGLIPQALLPKVSLIGNSALGGTVKFLLNPDNEKVLNQIAGQSEEFSLPEDKYFNTHFIDNINFE